MGVKRAFTILDRVLEGLDCGDGSGSDSNVEGEGEGEEYEVDEVGTLSLVMVLQ